MRSVRDFFVVILNYYKLPFSN